MARVSRLGQASAKQSEKIASNSGRFRSYDTFLVSKNAWEDNKKGADKGNEILGILGIGKLERSTTGPCFMTRLSLTRLL